MVFMMIVTLSAMVTNLSTYWSEGDVLLTSVAGAIFFMSLWLVVEAYLRLRRDETQTVAGD